LKESFPIPTSAEANISKVQAIIHTGENVALIHLAALLSVLTESRLHPWVLAYAYDKGV